MSKIVKYVVFGVIGVLAVVSVGAGYLLATFNPNDYKAQVIQLVKDKKQGDLRLDGDITLIFLPSIGANLGKVSLSEVNSDKQFAAIEDVHVSLALMPLFSQEMLVNEVVISGLQVTLVKHKGGRSNIDDLLGSNVNRKPDDSGQVKFDIASINIADANLNYSDEASGAQYSLKDFNLKTGRIANGVASNIVLSMAMQGNKPKLEVSTELQATLTFDLSKKQYSLDDLIIAVEATGDMLPNKSVSGELKGDIQIDATKQTLQINLAGGLLQSQLKAMVEVNGFSDPAIRFDMDVDQFDVDSYLPKEPVEAKVTTKEQRLDLSALRKLDLDGSLRIGSLKVANIKSSNVRVDVKARNGKLNLSPLSADLYQGRLDGSVSVNAVATPKITIKQKLTAINIATLSRDAANFDTLEGTGDVDINLTMQGNTVSAMKKRLNGNVSLSLADGAIKGINVAKKLREAKAMFAKGGTKVQTQAADKNEKTDFSELKASFKVKNGVARNNDLSLKAPLLRLTGSGKIDIANEIMNYLAKAALSKTLEGQGGADSVNGITVPVRISGSLSGLTYKLDFGAMVGGAAKQKIEAKKAEIKTKLQDKLKDSLKGLFR